MIRDTITHWVKTFPIKAATAVAVVRILTEEIFPRFGFCEQIHSDRGTQFTRNLVTEVARILGIKATTTPAYNPKSNPVERFHRDLGRAIKEQPNWWKEVLPHVLFAIRTSPCRSTGFATYKLLFGRDATIPLDLVFGPPPHTSSEHDSDINYVSALSNKIESAHAWARANMGRTITRQRAAYFKDRPTLNIPGQQVWLFTPKWKKGERRKFATYWTGLWTVKRKVNDLCYELLHDRRWLFYNKPAVVSIDRLKKFYAEECAPDFTQPPAKGDLVEMLGDKFAEAVHHNEYRAPVDLLPPVAGPMQGAGGGALPTPPGGAEGGGGGLTLAPPNQGNNDNGDNDYDNVPVVYVGPCRQAVLRHGPKIDWERKRRRLEDEGVAATAADADAAQDGAGWLPPGWGWFIPINDDPPAPAAPLQ
jgi:hypothetical protein